MRIRPFYLPSFARVGWMVSGWRRHWRVRWYTLNKEALVVVAVSGFALSGCGYFAYSLHAQEVERQNVTCLALNVYYEARGESRAGQYAVAEVTMNRLASPYYPKTLCGVVYQKGWDPVRKRYVSAFSWTEIDALSSPQHGPAWQRAWGVAEDVYYRRVSQPPELKNALHYHSVYIRPDWSDARKPLALIGNHAFYN
jgi:N-acetylmuramoyl-L-alanine amidase